VFLDATYCKARVDHRVVSQAVVVATGVAADGRREVLGFDVGDSEDGAFWTAFLRSLKTRGLRGVQLVISDAHAGLKAAIEAVLLGAAWQRCRVHFLRNVLAQVPKGHQEMVAAAIRTIFAQPDPEHVRSQLDVIAGMLGRQFPRVETMLRAAADDVTAFADFPVSHWKKIWSTNPLERVNKEIKRRTDVVGVFPNPPPCCAWPARCWSRPTTNGRSPTAVTCLNPRWPCSTSPPINPRRWPDQHYSRHDLKHLADSTTVKISYTTGRDVTFSGRSADESRHIPAACSERATSCREQFARSAPAQTLLR
jgi:putative transposase